jgi:ADP-ribose pyrophosphatase YjhB (NUDIX family)
MERPLVGALAVVARNDAVLLVARGRAPNRGLWGFPGGHVELGETVAEAATRELREETGVDARAQGTLGTLDVIERGPDGAIAWHYVLVAVRLAWLSGEPVAADDAEDARWLTAAERAALPLAPRVEEVLGWARGGAPFTAAGSAPMSGGHARRDP